MVGFLTLSLQDNGFILPSEISYRAGGGYDGGIGRGFRRVELARQSIWFDVLTARPVGNGKVEPVKEEAPTCLTAVEPFSSA